jgi:hypothetical protein
MPVFGKGSTGEKVVRIQMALKAAGFFENEPDGLFGDRTEAAVKGFQARSGLAADGMVGPATWGKLFPSEASAPGTFGDLASRCLALTGSFETGRPAPECFATVTGNFDGQGMSFGALQWNLGQGTLQPLLRKMFRNHRNIAATIFGPDLEALERAVSGGKVDCFAFAASIQDQGKKTVVSPWSRMFRSLGLTPQFQEIEIEGAASYYARAVRLCREYRLLTERGRALMFDICVQNGFIPDRVKTLILADFDNLGKAPTPAEAEVERMRIVANRRAEASNPRFVEDVRRRKLCIAEGKGVVHGISYDLEKQYGLSLRKAD